MSTEFYPKIHVEVSNCLIFKSYQCCPVSPNFVRKLLKYADTFLQPKLIKGRLRYLEKWFRCDTISSLRGEKSDMIKISFLQLKLQAPFCIHNHNIEMEVKLKTLGGLHIMYINKEPWNKVSSKAESFLKEGV